MIQQKKTTSATLFLIYFSKRKIFDLFIVCMRIRNRKESRCGIDCYFHQEKKGKKPLFLTTIFYSFFLLLVNWHTKKQTHKNHVSYKSDSTLNKKKETLASLIILFLFYLMTGTISSNRRVKLNEPQKHFLLLFLSFTNLELFNM